MSALATCPSCQWGDHDGHVADWKPPPPGALGGFYCACPGDCIDLMSDVIRYVLDVLTEPADPD